MAKAMQRTGLKWALILHSKSMDVQRSGRLQWGALLLVQYCKSKIYIANCGMPYGQVAMVYGQGAPPLVPVVVLWSLAPVVCGGFELLFRTIALNVLKYIFNAYFRLCVHLFSFLWNCGRLINCHYVKFSMLNLCFIIFGKPGCL